MFVFFFTSLALALKGEAISEIAGRFLDTLPAGDFDVCFGFFIRTFHSFVGGETGCWALKILACSLLLDFGDGATTRAVLSPANFIPFCSIPMFGLSIGFSKVNYFYANKVFSSAFELCFILYDYSTRLGT